MSSSNFSHLLPVEQSYLSLLQEQRRPLSAITSDDLSAFINKTQIINKCTKASQSAISMSQSSLSESWPDSLNNMVENICNDISKSIHEIQKPRSRIQSDTTKNSLYLQRSHSNPFSDKEISDNLHKIEIHLIKIKYCVRKIQKANDEKLLTDELVMTFSDSLFLQLCNLVNLHNKCKKYLSKCEKDNPIVTCIQQALSKLPDLLNSIDLIYGHMDSMEGTFQNIKDELISVERTICNKQSSKTEKDIAINTKNKLLQPFIRKCLYSCILETIPHLANSLKSDQPLTEILFDKNFIKNIQVCLRDELMELFTSICTSNPEYLEMYQNTSSSHCIRNFNQAQAISNSVCTLFFKDSLPSLFESNNKPINLLTFESANVRLCGSISRLLKIVFNLNGTSISESDFQKFLRTLNN